MTPSPAAPAAPASAVRLPMTQSDLWALGHIHSSSEVFRSAAEKLAGDRERALAELEQRAGMLRAFGARIAEERASLYQALALTHGVEIPEGAELVNGALVWIPVADGPAA